MDFRSSPACLMLLEGTFFTPTAECSHFTTAFQLKRACGSFLFRGSVGTDHKQHPLWMLMVLLNVTGPQTQAGPGLPLPPQGQPQAQHFG